MRCDPRIVAIGFAVSGKSFWDNAFATINLSPLSSTTTYSASAFTANPVFPGKVQGVVVHARKNVDAFESSKSVE
jgi:hypothetical protein